MKYTPRGTFRQRPTQKMRRALPFVEKITAAQFKKFFEPCRYRIQPEFCRKYLQRTGLVAYKNTYC